MSVTNALSSMRAPQESSIWSALKKTAVKGSNWVIEHKVASTVCSGITLFSGLFATNSFGLKDKLFNFINPQETLPDIENIPPLEPQQLPGSWEACKEFLTWAYDSTASVINYENAAFLGSQASALTSSAFDVVGYLPSYGVRAIKLPYEALDSFFSVFSPFQAAVLCFGIYLIANRRRLNTPRLSTQTPFRKHVDAGLNKIIRGGRVWIR